MTTAVEVKHVLIGTAGHIDHGKTRLVGRLTNIDTDRLPEEKVRGISIDLGFAHWETDGFQFGIVDVPGHERFVKNMVAGATGVNLALLVIAADDGVMPQTREHLEIMELLGLQTGLIAITKIDLVDPEFVELVTAEIEDLVAGTFLEGCPIVPVSSETGEGIDLLRSTVMQIASEVEWPEAFPLFRMPIDRVFSVTGHGTIVTGSVVSGDVKAGDTLMLLPEEREVRVRSVQNHGIQSGDSGPRQRTAINLAGVKTDELERGQELATPGYLHPTRRILVELRSLSSSSLVLKDRLTLSLHLGTSETPARLILKGQQLKPGDRAFAELRVKHPIVAAHGQRFILRRISPALTLAGGIVLDPFIAPFKRIKDIQAAAAALNRRDEEERLEALLAQRNFVETSPFEAAWRTGVHPDRYSALIDHLKSEGRLVRIGSSDRALLIHRGRLESLARSVMRIIREELARRQPRRALPRKMLLTACREIAPQEILEAVFDDLLKQKQLVRVAENLGPADIQVQLTKNQQQARAKILEVIGQQALSPPTTKELAAETGQKLDQIEPLLNLCVEDGLLVKVAENLYFSPEAIEQGRLACRELLQETPEATMAQLRDGWEVSRKFAVPLCEFYDRCGVTVRQGDLRVAGPNIDQPMTG